MYSRDPSLRPAAPDPDALEAQALVHETDEVRAKLRTVVPWVVSLGAHVGVLVLASLAVFIVKPLLVKPVLPIPDLAIGKDEIQGFENKAPGPRAELVGDLGVGGPPPTDDTAPPLPAPPSVSQGVARSQVAPTVAHFIRGPKVVDIVHGRGPADSGRGIFKVGGSGDGGGEDGGQRAANRIVFLVDASGSLVDTLPFVVESLSRQIDTDLDAKRQFNVIFFSGAGVNREAGAVKGLATLFPSRLEPANAANRGRAITWVHQVEAGGSGDPLAAIKKAFEMDPDQIHLLSDNITGSGIWEVHQDRFMQELMKGYQKAVARRQAAGGGRIDIKTYQFVYPDPVEKIGREPTLLRIVKDTGGRPADYCFVTAHSLGLR